jgi:hypothetical protein
MKRHRLIASVTLPFFALGCLIVPKVLRAVGNPDSADITKLLTDTRAIAAMLRADSNEMESFTRSKATWENYSSKLFTITGHINNAGELLAKLKGAESTGSPWQQETIKRIEPLLQEMASNLTTTINTLKDNPKRVHFPEFISYVKANATLAIDLESMLRTSIGYGNDLAKFETLTPKS